MEGSGDAGGTEGSSLLQSPTYGLLVICNILSENLSTCKRLLRFTLPIGRNTKCLSYGDRKLRPTFCS